MWDVLRLSGTIPQEEMAMGPEAVEYVMDPYVSFLVYIVVMTSLAVLLMLVLVLTLEIKVNRILNKLDGMSRDAGRFIRVGLKFFRSRTD